MAAATAPSWQVSPVSAAQQTNASAWGGEERNLVHRAQEGEVDAYEELFRRHQQRVLAIIAGILRRSEDTEDVGQQVFLKVYRSLHRFDLRSSFSTWLYKVTVNECLDHLRKRKVRKLVYEADLNQEQGGYLDAAAQRGERHHPPDTAREIESKQLVDRLLGELPEEERLMMVLKEVEGWTVEEIGAVLALNVNTVKVRLFRARIRLVDFYRRRMANRPSIAEKRGAGHDM